MERETIVFENTWANVAPMLAELLINGSHHAQNFAREELATMARAADAWVQHLKNHGQAIGHDD